MDRTNAIARLNTEEIVNEVNNVIKNGLNKLLGDHLYRYELLEKTHKALMNLPSIRNELNQNPYESKEYDFVKEYNTRHQPKNDLDTIKYDLLIEKLTKRIDELTREINQQPYESKDSDFVKEYNNRHQVKNELSMINLDMIKYDLIIEKLTKKIDELTYEINTLKTTMSVKDEPRENIKLVIDTSFNEDDINNDNGNVKEEIKKVNGFVSEADASEADASEADASEAEVEDISNAEVVNSSESEVEDISNAEVVNSSEAEVEEEILSIRRPSEEELRKKEEEENESEADANEIVDNSPNDKYSIGHYKSKTHINDPLDFDN
jgi:hypothetical protein